MFFWSSSGIDVLRGYLDVDLNLSSCFENIIPVAGP